MDKNIRGHLFSACALNKRKIYAFTNFGRLPICFDLNSREIKIINHLKDYQILDSDKMLSYDDNLFVLETNGKKMLQYDLKKNECLYYDIFCGKKEWGNYAEFAIYDKKAFIFPTYENSIIKVNLVSRKVQKDDRLYTDIYENKLEKNSSEDYMFFSCGCQLKNIVWIFQKKGNVAIAYDMKTDTWMTYELPTNINDCLHAVHHAGKIYLLSSEGKIYCWNISCESMELIADCSCSDTNYNLFARIAVTDRNIFLLPALGDEIFCIDLNLKQIEKYKDYPEDFHYSCPSEWSKYYGYCEDEISYYFALRSANYVLTINKKNGQEKWLKPKLLSREEYISWYIKYNKNMFCETECTLNEMLSFSMYDSMKKNKCDLSYGYMVWEHIKNI